MTSCVDEMIDSEGVQSSQVAFIISDFESAEQTKSAFQMNGSKLKFQWSADDAIGIFPEEGWQTEFSMEEGAGTSVAVFDGGSWGLKPEAVYYAYYPFSKDNFESKDMRERVKYSYEGQEACFADGEGVVDLSGYDFMASGASTVENESVSFRFKHLGALCRIRFGVPATATYSYFVLESGEERFSMSGYFDATDRDGDGIALTADSEAGTQFKVLFPEGHQAFAGNSNIEFYFLMPPVNLTGQPLVFSVVDNQGNNHDFEIEPKNIVAGMTYSWDVNCMPEPLDSEGTANSYIVSEAGAYSFHTVKGNSSTSVGDVASAEVLWETYGTDVAPEVGALVSNVSYSDNVITFKASDKKGNALIAAKDAAGTILWSWHIWMTDQPVDQVYRNGAGTMLDRNLGATSATPGDVGALGLLYQWGRKDPFLGSSSITESIRAVSVGSLEWSVVESTENNGTIDYVTANPTTFVTSNSNNSDWLYADDATVDITRWQSNKTIYDPCPAGYRVPDGGEQGVWSVAFGSADSYPLWDAINIGYNFGGTATNTKYLTDITCWYPSTGVLDSRNADLNGTGTKSYCGSCTLGIEQDPYVLSFKEGYVSSIGSLTSFSTGFSVRCQKITPAVEYLFSETFDWVAPWADTYGSADSVGDNNPSGAAPNVYTQATHLEGGVSEGYPAFLTEFANRGYEDANPDVTSFYTQKYYLKFGKTGKNTGIKLPPIDFGTTGRDVVLKFNWACHRRVKSGVDETDPVNIVVEVLDAEGNSVFVSDELVTTQPLGKMEWQDASVKLSNITSSDRIVIRPSNMSPEANAVNRWYLDNIYIY